MVISIDGPAASGKSTTAKLLANKLGFIHLNSGLLYRAVTYLYLNKYIFVLDEEYIRDFFLNNELNLHGENLDKVLFNGSDISKYLSMENINKTINDISNNLVIRKILVEKQRILSLNKNIVCEGRDIGTVVFPSAKFKFYLSADLESRALRRFCELSKDNKSVSKNDVLQNLINRDKNDINRQHSPLRKAEDAIEINTTNMSIDEQVKQLYKQIKQGTIND
ncbi:(d)CMP kinase [Candidatus Marinimicrobia bacterium]|nr:(d)CMP kinase [Candidatus Neomarinimicrobiota bacterium]